DVGTAAAALAPYAAIRLTAYLRGTDPVTDAHMAEMIAEDVSPWRYVQGAWAGLRCNWFHVVAWGWLAWRTRPRWWAVLALLATASSMYVMIHVASDIHRSAAVFVPVATAGMVLLHRTAPALNARALAVLALLSCALPASHVVTAFDIPIQGLVD